MKLIQTDVGKKFTFPQWKNGEWLEVLEFRVNKIEIRDCGGKVGWMPNFDDWIPLDKKDLRRK